jgi:integrase
MIKKVHNSRFPENRLGELPMVVELLKKKEKSHLRKKSNTFTREQIAAFVELCGNGAEYAVMILISIFMLFGALRKKEASAMTIDHVKPYDDHICVTIPDPKTGPRSYVVPDQYGVVGRFKDYMEKRKLVQVPRLWLRWQKSHYSSQVIGLNRIAQYPAEIAKVLSLSEPEKWTSHAFRRTAATWAADAGIDMINLKRFGNWKSDTVAEGYIADSTTNKRKIADMVAGSEPAPKKSSEVRIVDQTGPALLSVSNCANVSFANCTFILSGAATPKPAPAE